MARQPKIKFLHSLFAVFFMLSICCLLVFVSTASSFDLAGEWQGTWYDCSGYSSYLGGTIYQNGSTLSGVGSIYSLACGPVQNIPLTGSVSNGIAYVQGSAYCPPYYQTATYSLGGTLTADNYMSGNFMACLGSSCDAGTFNMTAQTVNLSVSILGSTSGTVRIDQPGTLCSSGTACNVSVRSGILTTLTANPTTNLRFVLFSTSSSALGQFTYMDLEPSKISSQPKLLSLPLEAVY